MSWTFFWQLFVLEITFLVGVNEVVGTIARRGAKR